MYNFPKYQKLYFFLLFKAHHTFPSYTCNKPGRCIKINNTMLSEQHAFNFNYILLF